MTNIHLPARTCARCSRRLPRGSRANRYYCSDRCRAAAAQAARRARMRERYNEAQRAVMRRVRMRRGLDNVVEQARRHDPSPLAAELSHLESANVFRMLLRRTIGILSVTGRDPIQEWRKRHRNTKFRNS